MLQDGDKWVFEKFDLTNGLSKAKPFSKQGWKGMMVLGKGKSSVRTRIGKSDDSNRATEVGGSSADDVLVAEE
jgi:hypothetical protein